MEIRRRGIILLQYLARQEKTPTRLKPYCDSNLEHRLLYTGVV